MKCAKKQLKKIASAVAAAMLLVSSCFTGLATVAAVSYEGEGTANSPYLIKTAEQLEGIRQNLSACYKLAANIDLSGYKSSDPSPKGNYNGGWVPIGTYGERFTGVFTCDLGSDGNPLYTISNLTVTNLAGEIYAHRLDSAASYTDAVNGKCYWEAGLFGTVENATIENIHITNANIRNTTIGQNQVDSTNTAVPCSNQMGTAILVAKAYNSSISGCKVKGTVNSATNATGGLVGSASETKVTDCSVEATITATGLWSIGGLGYFQKSTVERCAVNVTMDAPYSSVGAFAASDSESTFKNCYAVGTIKNNNTFFSGEFKNPSKSVKNCFSLVTRTDGKTLSGTVSDNNSYIVAGGYSSQYAVTTKEELLKLYSSISGWDCSGEYPVLAKTASVSASSGESGNTVATQSGSSVTGGEDTVEGSAEVGTSAVLINGIDILTALEDLPDDAYNVELEDAKYYLELYYAYTLMPESMKKELDEDQISIMDELGPVVSKKVLKDLEKRIAALPDTDKLTEKDTEELTDIVELYKLILPEYQAKMTDENYKKLTASLEALGLSGLLEAEDDSLQTVQKWIFIFCIVINILLLAGVVFMVIMTILNIRKRKAEINEPYGDELE